MTFKISNYSFGYAIAPFAASSDAHLDLEAEGSPHWYYHDNKLTAFPEESDITVDAVIRNKLSQLHDYDVLEIFENGTATRQYDATSDDAVLFVTERCNSNCIMCPMPEGARRHGQPAEIDRLILIAKQIPKTAPHITITGGEPFMAGRTIFRLLDFCQSKFDYTEFLLLTNARALAIQEYSEMLRDTLPSNSIIGVPLHGSSASTHDTITRSQGSFQQTITGLLNIQAFNIRTELRIVVSKLNHEEMTSIAKLIVSLFPHVDHVCFMSMEMTGEARKNADLVWLPYRLAFESCKEAIKILIASGINVRLYNFPLCTVDPAFWTICRKSISPEKVRFSVSCASCSVKDACGGVFAGTLPLVRQEMVSVV
jgi:His-Xaa-Ser system radical SAM maturase HxsC